MGINLEAAESKQNNSDQVKSSKHDADWVHLHFDQLLTIRLHFEAVIKQFQQDDHQLFTGD